MVVENFKVLYGKKYMWDSRTYQGESEARAAAETYKKDNFETEVVEEDGQFLVYTRRVVTEVIVEGTPP